MRILIAAPLLLLGACNVQKDAGNDTTTLSFNQDLAENTIADVGNAAENIGADVANEADKTADKIHNKVGDVDVKVTHNDADDATENKQ